VRHRLEVVDKAQKRREHGREQRQHQRAVHGRQDQARRDDGHQQHHAAHGGRALLLQVALGAVGADLLADLAVA